MDLESVVGVRGCGLKDGVKLINVAVDRCLSYARGFIKEINDVSRDGRVCFDTKFEISNSNLIYIVVEELIYSFASRVIGNILKLYVSFQHLPFEFHNMLDSALVEATIAAVELHRNFGACHNLSGTVVGRVAIGLRSRAVAALRDELFLR